MAFAPSTTCASSCPVARNIAATTLATWALNPRLAAFAEPTRFLRVLSSATASGVVCRRSSTTSRGIRTSAVTLRPRPSTALMAAGFCRNRGCPRGRRARRPSRLRRRRRRPRWRWWPCSSPSRPWCRSGIAGTPSCRRRTASRRGVRRGSSSPAASFSAAKLSRVHETSASASATSATRNTGARVIPDLRTRAVSRRRC